MGKKSTNRSNSNFPPFFSSRSSNCTITNTFLQTHLFQVLHTLVAPHMGVELLAPHMEAQLADRELRLVHRKLHLAGREHLLVGRKLQLFHKEPLLVGKELLYTPLVFSLHMMDS